MAAHFVHLDLRCTAGRIGPTLLVLIWLAALTPVPGGAAGLWYVATGGGDSNSCSTPAAPCATLSGAVGKASAGDTIRVGMGTYTGAGGNEVVLLDKDLILSGGWDATFSAQTGMSTVDGQAARSGIAVGTAVVFLERFVVRNGLVASGYGGAGIYNTDTGTLTIVDSSITGNSGRGITNDGTLTLERSTVGGNTGGGIYNEGTLTLNNSTVRDNTASGGGAGVFAFKGTVALNNSTVSGNTAPGNYGGGIFANYGSRVRVSSSTISSNAGGAGGGGIFTWFGGEVILQNSILSGNSAPDGPDCGGTSVTSSGHNLVGSTAGCPFAMSTGDLANRDARIFPLIGTPAFHALLPGSPAIDAGNPAGCTDNLGNLLSTDERGVPRVGRCDIGAYEFDPNHYLLPWLYLPLLRQR